MNSRPREPFFGQNAKPWFIQLAFVIFCIIVVVPLLSDFFRPYVTTVVDSACAFTGWCEPG